VLVGNQIRFDKSGFMKMYYFEFNKLAN